ncbi:MAG: hypothetical protein KKA61_03370, partial [Nanoarchaeota archaeon]|nr:hypothetical protein [Nanoarchaeota archaeon]
MKKTFLIGSLIGLFFMLFLATTVSATLTINQNTFVNCSIGHCFNVTAGVTGDGLNITATNISKSEGTCDNIANSTSGNYFNSTWNCSGTALQPTNIIIGFTNASNDYNQTDQSSNTYPNNAPTISAGTTITIDSHESSDTAIISASDADSDLLNYSVTTADDSLVKCTIPIGTTTLTATRVNDTKPTATTNCTVTVTDGTASAPAVFTITVNRKSMLEIYDLDVDVDGKSKDLDDGDTIKEASPESEIKFDFEIKNLFDEDIDDIEIEDILITVTIKDIDDGDDLEEETKEFDLDAE